MSKGKSLSHVQLFATPWTVARQAPLSMGFSRQEYWSGSPFPSPGDFPNPGIEPGSPALQAETLSSEPPGNELTLNNLDEGPSPISVCKWEKSTDDSNPLRSVPPPPPPDSNGADSAL